MEINPNQLDPQFQDPLRQDSARQSQVGMDSQADRPLRGMSQDAVHADMLGAAGVPGTPGARPLVDARSIVTGTAVHGTDGRQIGTVHQVFNDCILVQKGIFFTHDYYIPFTYVVSADSQRIVLGIPSDLVGSIATTEPPGEGLPGNAAAAHHTGEPGVYGVQDASDTIQDVTARERDEQDPRV